MEIERPEIEGSSIAAKSGSDEAVELLKQLKADRLLFRAIVSMLFLFPIYWAYLLITSLNSHPSEFRCYFATGPIELFLCMIFWLEFVPGLLSVPLFLLLIGCNLKNWRAADTADAARPWNRQNRTLPIRLLLVVLMINPVLSYFIMPFVPRAAFYYVANHKETNSKLISHIISMQVAAEEYAVHSGAYPFKYDAELQKFFPKSGTQFYAGDCVNFRNVIDGSRDWLVIHRVSGEPEAKRVAECARPGQVIYCFLNDSKHSNFWILGKNGFNKLYTTLRGTLVLTKTAISPEKVK